MEKLNRKAVTLAAILGLGVLLSAISFCGWSPYWNQSLEETAKNERLLESSQELLTRKQQLEAEWTAKRAYIKEGASGEDMLNPWMKEIFAYAQAHSLKISKMEPAGTRQREGKKEPLLFLTFQADVKQWSAFLYYLLESDPMAKIESFSLKQDEDSKHLSIELILGKVVL